MYKYFARTNPISLAVEWVVALAVDGRTIKLFADEAGAAAWVSYLNGGPVPPAAAVAADKPPDVDTQTVSPVILGDIP